LPSTPRRPTVPAGVPRARGYSGSPATWCPPSTAGRAGSGGRSAAGGRWLLDADDIARTQDRIDAAARARELYVALDGLPEGERAVFELHALDGMTPSEAAAALGIRAITARVRLHRAHAALHGQLLEGDTQPMEA
jgi:RNA polymerase sigma-70 factor, ECF subfamily